ncbi:MAG: hypothetical protein ACREJ2_07760 [Planctomycetota bacterium]
MLSRTSVPLLVLICAALVAGVSLTVHFAYNQDQVAADRQVQAIALELAAGVENRPLPADRPIAEDDLPPLLATLRAKPTQPFDARTPLRLDQYEWRYDATRRLLVGRPRFYGRGFWLTVAVVYDPAAQRFHFYVNDAGGRWAVSSEPDGTGLGPDWHEYLHADVQEPG